MYLKKITWSVTPWSSILSLASVHNGTCKSIPLRVASSLFYVTKEINVEINFLQIE
jgi:hypothetical protein